MSFGRENECDMAHQKQRKSKLFSDLLHSCQINAHRGGTCACSWAQAAGYAYFVQRVISRYAGQGTTGATRVSTPYSNIELEPWQMFGFIAQVSLSFRSHS
jgi:hypothetical protein